jgi:hypothetical protein
MDINSSIYIYKSVPHDSSILQLSGQKKRTELTKTSTIGFHFFFGYLFDISSKNHCTTTEKKS